MWLGANVGEIVLRLLHKPAFRAAAENLRQPNGHLGRNAALFIHQFGKRGAGDPQRAAAAMLRPKGSMHWRSTNPPGWGGFFIGMVHVSVQW